ncbi:hypothetical protein EVAR_14493_1 [Eumeta japonica]|uniref:Uncharacterized protein n=1 Tax=Eumeta variegata TaxID=151549 RepID=A0A4C1U3T2_EUMVA|nr:hypothetical protein EVAR_14493_1 [Eumeta japonica]
MSVSQRTGTTAQKETTLYHMCSEMRLRLWLVLGRGWNIRIELADNRRVGTSEKYGETLSLGHQPSSPRELMAECQFQ